MSSIDINLAVPALTTAPRRHPAPISLPADRMQDAPAESGPSGMPAGEVFVASPPPMPWPRILPGL